MMCYRDRTFCSRACANFSCHYNITPAEKEFCNYDGIPVAYADRKSDICGYVPYDTTRKNTDNN